MAFGKQPLIIRFEKELSDQQLDQTFAVSTNTAWYRAIVQLIRQHREQFVSTAPGWANTNNSLGMARDCGAAEALQGLLIELEIRRSKNAD